MKLSYIILLILVCFSCQKESKDLPTSLDQLLNIEKEIQFQKTSNCNSIIEKQLCASKWYFDFNFNRQGKDSFSAKKNKNSYNDFPFTFLCDGSTVFRNKRFQNNQSHLNQKVFWKIKDGLLILELTYLSSDLKSKHVFNFELNQNNTQFEIKNISNSSYQFLTYFIGTGCEG
ncbi:MAG: hypothetical protein AB8H03_12785 [Saprospiraceae bacterium]